VLPKLKEIKKEPVWSHHPQAQPNCSRLMPIAPILNQLVEKGSLLVEALPGRLISLKATTRDLLAEIKTEVLPWDQCRAGLRRRWPRLDAS